MHLYANFTKDSLSLSANGIDVLEYVSLFDLKYRPYTNLREGLLNTALVRLWTRGFLDLEIIDNNTGLVIHY